MAGYVPKNILVFGATGTIGRYIVEALIENKTSFGKIAVFTSPQSATEKRQAFAKLKDRRVEIITGDLTDEKSIANVYNGRPSNYARNRTWLTLILTGFDTVVSALGRTAAISMQIPLIKVAE